MAYKKFNSTETEYTGTDASDLIIGNDLGNFIDGGNGNDVIAGGAGDDILLGGEGNDIIFGGAGGDTIDVGNGTNIAFGDSGIDSIFGGDGNDILDGGADNDEIYGGDGDDILTGGGGADYVQGDGASAGDETVDGNVFLVTSDDLLLGGEDNDTFIISSEVTGVIIEAGISDLDNEGEEARYVEVEEDEGTGELTVLDTTTGLRIELDDIEVAEQTETDVRIDIAYHPGSTTAISTFASSIAGYNAVDTLEFTKSGDFSESLAFSGIERIELASGVNITLSAEQLLNNGESLDLGFLNPGTHIYGVAGGPAESVTLELEYADTEFVPADTIVGATTVTYSASELQFDDFTVANLFHNVDMIYDASEGLAGSYVRIDGANESAGASETVYGSAGVDNATMRLGDDTYYANDGNDLIVGHGGADKLYGEAGDDIFTIGGFGSGVQGTTSKADDGNAEWIATGANHDLIVGGLGVDTLRITTGIGAVAGNNTIVLNNANFQSMEVVQVGGTAGRLNVENAALQLLNDHYYHRANSSVADLSNTLGNNGGSINNVVVDASGVTTNGLRFEGNANTNTFIGTTKADVFVGNGGNDTLTGGTGKDTFVFGQVHEQVITGAATEVQTYVDTAFNLTGVDTITDFLHGTDKVELHLDQYSQLAGFNTSMLRVNATGTAADANDYLLFNTTSKMLSYDADGSGAGAAVSIAQLLGVNTFTASDVVVV
ncbi:MAG: calcium-binding protein [Methylotenera sp.]|uniref:calcium-binding protein n=1 Tax=Methylotenera sp. TaxID=2051956 RepID=UPI0024892C1D|nr:calcium-binding protein [Methylotenera sp.]MDI1308945.1 calcium-binding protein [Methylotenera sp.]